ncbi:MAG: hypothetical protein ACOYN0_06170 [Phycisphaerales bacterium]
MDTFHDPLIPFTAPNSPLNTLLTNFFDPAHTLQSIAASLGLTLEGLVNYIAIPEVAAALDKAEADILHRASLRATAALESVRTQLQSLRPLPIAPAPAEASRRSTPAPRCAPRSKPPRPAPGLALDKEVPKVPPPQESPQVGRGRPLDRPRPSWNQPAISFRPPARARFPHFAASAESRPAASPAYANLRRQAPALFGTPYTHGQAG